MLNAGKEVNDSLDAEWMDLRSSLSNVGSILEVDRVELSKEW
jgi:hypothetical protein